MRNQLHLLAVLVTVSLSAAIATAQDTAPLVADKEFVYICRDAGAGAYEAFPDVCRLKDGRLMAIFYAGYGHVAMPNEALPKGGRAAACYSSDEGKTWTPAETIVDTDDDDRDPSVVQLSDGRLMCSFFSLRKKADGGYRGLGSYVSESGDAGKTWSTPRIISTYYCSAPIRELKNGNLVLGLYQDEGGDAWGAVTISTDKGATWSRPYDIPNGGLRLDAETDVIELKDGALYAAQRTEKESMRFSKSTDGGKTWSVSEPMGFPGHCPYLHRTPDGIVLIAHRVPNTSLHYSLDDCATWSQNVPVDSVGGAYPGFVNLNDGSVLIVYYEEGEGSSIRARKFKATANGIEWLTW
ncbi:MAG: exo-alpha-sialidase [Candidatus Hydrogenedentes bacterium]|nr:exo-alpha-sialidase [Candidatus Hydrogenedentota bacterium]